MLVGVRVTEWRGLPHESRLLRHHPPAGLKWKQTSGGPPCDQSQSSHLNSASRVKNRYISKVPAAHFTAAGGADLRSHPKRSDKVKASSYHWKNEEAGFLVSGWDGEAVRLQVSLCSRPRR